MSTFTFDETLFGDLHKDAYGFRPKGDYYAWLVTLSDVEKQTEWDRLCDVLGEEIRLQQEAHDRAAERFEVRIANLIRNGAKDFEMAIKWLHESYDTNGDDNYLEYYLGVSYGQIKKFREAQV